MSIHTTKRRSIKRLNAFSLTEVLVTLVIIGILVLLALPNLMPLITRAKSTEAKVQLEHVHTLQKNYFFEHSKYTSDLAEIGFEQEILTTESGRANYRIEVISADNTSFLVRATAITDFNGNGIFNVWEIDQEKRLKETVKD